MRLPSYVNLLTTVLFIFILSLLSGCRQNQNPAGRPVLQEQIIGLWKFDSYREVTTLNGVVNNDETQPVSGTMEFRRNGKVISVDEAGNTEEGSWLLVDGGKRVKIIFSDLASAGIQLSSFLSGETFELKEINPENLALCNLSSLSAGGQSVKYELTFNLAK